MKTKKDIGIASHRESTLSIKSGFHSSLYTHTQIKFIKLINTFGIKIYNTQFYIVFFYIQNVPANVFFAVYDQWLSNRSRRQAKKTDKFYL